MIYTSAYKLWKTHIRSLLNFAAGVCVLATCFGCGGGGTEALPIEPAIVVLGIGNLPGDVSSEAASVSSDGLVVVGSSKSAAGKSRAFRWTRLSGMNELGLLDGGTASSAKAASADGSVVIGSGNSQSSGSAIFRWTAATGMVQLKALNNSGLCVAGGVSGAGDIVVGTCLIAGNAAFRWTVGSGMAELGQFGGGSNRSSNAQAISTDGNTIVGVGHPALTGAVLWDAQSGANILGTLGGDISAAANAVSRDGRVVVGFSVQPSTHTRAFHWNKPGPMIELGPTRPDLSDTVASAVSGDGRVVVGWGKTAGGEAAFMWDELHGMRLLDELANPNQDSSAVWKLSRATGISDNGRVVVGVGINSKGNAEGWIVSIPSPSP